jgi:endonuclease/exonuclease/phosphatase family metal-dependent hydrolase
MNTGAAASSESHPQRIEPAFAPIVHNRERRPRQDGPLRVVLFNAAGGIRLGGIASCLARFPLNRASIILLCESDWRTSRSGNREVAAELAALLGMSFAFVPEFGLGKPDAESNAYNAYLGNAILSANPFEEVRAVGLPQPPGSSAGYWRGQRIGAPAGLVAHATYSGIRIAIGVAHLASRTDPPGRELQMRTYLAGFPTQGPAIFGGDLNTTTTRLSSPGALLRTAAQMLVNPNRFRQPQRYEPLFERLADHALEIHGANVMRRSTFTFSRAIPRAFRPKLDWLATRELTPVRKSAAVIPARASILSSRVSDHDFVMVDIQL